MEGKIANPQQNKMGIIFEFMKVQRRIKDKELLKLQDLIDSEVDRRSKNDDQNAVA